MTQYYIDVRHDGLNMVRRITASDRSLLHEKASRQMARWNEQWERKQAADRQREAREQLASGRERRKEVAAERTTEAQEAIAAIDQLLASSQKLNKTFAWADLMRNDEGKPSAPVPALSPAKKSESEFTPHLGLLDYFLPPRRSRKEKEAAAEYRRYLLNWSEESKRQQDANERAQQDYQKACERWEKERKEHNHSVEVRQAAYLAGKPEAIEDYCELVLSSSKYPDGFPSEFHLEYRSGPKMILVDYQLPAPEALPRLREVRYIQSRDEFNEVLLPDSVFNRLYDSCLYQISLRTISELFRSDQIGAIKAVVFNGWVKAVDKGTGHEVSGCILSIQESKEEFDSINLEQVDPKACFKTLKGVGSAKLHGLAPVKPILELNKNDVRFIAAMDVADSLSEGDNLAAMDWQDFEQLIRQVFEAEFAQNGGEVKVTRASRDRGVDAVAFDPDPIRGGKIVIQAKRYTNTVGVSAVRDLYGTVMNEGAMKGILVCTSDYGPDAYEFVKDKPLTLLNGANLLHMLERYGHKARIDLQEARILLKEQEREQADGNAWETH